MITTAPSRAGGSSFRPFLPGFETRVAEEHRHEREIGSDRSFRDLKLLASWILGSHFSRSDRSFRDLKRLAPDVALSIARVQTVPSGI